MYVVFYLHYPYITPTLPLHYPTLPLYYPTLPLHYPYIAPILPLHYPCITPTLPLYYPYITPTLPQAAVMRLPTPTGWTASSGEVCVSLLQLFLSLRPLWLWQCV